MLFYGSFTREGFVDGFHLFPNLQARETSKLLSSVFQPVPTVTQSRHLFLFIRSGRKGTDTSFYGINNVKTRALCDISCRLHDVCCLSRLIKLQQQSFNSEIIRAVFIIDRDIAHKDEVSFVNKPSDVCFLFQVTLLTKTASSKSNKLKKNTKN